MHPVEILLYVLIAVAAVGSVIGFGAKAIEAIRRDLIRPPDVYPSDHPDKADSE